MSGPDELLAALSTMPPGTMTALRVPLDVTEAKLLAELAAQVPGRRFSVRDVSLEWSRSLAELPDAPAGPALPSPEGLAALVLKLQPHYAEAHPDPQASLVQALLPALRAKRLRVQGEVGLVAWTLDPDAPGEGGVLFLGVRPEARGRKVGRALLLAALHGLKRDGATLARGTARAGNGAMNHLFAALGYREEALHFEVVAE